MSVHRGTRCRTCPGCNVPHADHGWGPPHKFCLGKPDDMDCVQAYKNIEEEFHNKEKVKSTLEVPNVLAEDDPVAEVAGPVELSLSDEEDILVERLQKLKLEEQMLTRKQRIADLRRAVTEKEKKINVLSHCVQAGQAATLQDTKWRQCVVDPSSVPARKLTCKDLKKLAGKSFERTPWTGCLVLQVWNSLLG